MMRRTNPSACFFTLSLLLVLLNISQSILNYPPNLYIDTRWLISANPMGFLQNSNTNINLNWRYPFGNVSQHSLLLTNFQTTDKIISYEIRLTIINQISSVLTFSPKGVGSTIIQVGFTILLVQQSNNFLEIINVYSPQTNSSNFNVSSSKFQFDNGVIFKIQCFLSSININAAITAGGFQKNSINWSTFPSTSFIQLNFYSNLAASEVLGIYVDVIIFTPNTLNHAVAFYLQQYPFFLTDFGIPNGVFGAGLDHYCIFGFQYIQGYSGNQNATFMFATLGTSIATLNSNLFAYNMGIWCFAECPPSTFIASTSSYTCLNCMDYLPHCVSCLSSVECTKCSDGFVLSPTTKKCFRCSDEIQYCQFCLNQTFCTFCMRGTVVTGGCSDDPGCTQVLQLTSVSGPYSQCVKCDQSSFYYQNLNCVCKTDTFQAGSYCITDAGCINSVKIAGVIQCVLCDSSKYFQFNATSKNCTCQDGFELSVDTCIDICGDGRIFTQPCDDGNIINGDGCSSNCIVESKYKCGHGSSSSPSLCQYIGRDLRISLAETQKYENSNQGVFTFKFSPHIPSLSKMNLSHYFTFNCSNAEFSVVNWSYNEGFLTLKVDYSTDLQTKQAQVKFSFNQSLVFQWNPIIVNFTIHSDGELLIVHQLSSNSIILSYFLLGTSGVAALLIIVGSLVHRMIGVEFVTTLQVIYYLHFTARLYFPASSIFQYLSAIGLNNLFLQKSQQNFNSNTSLEKVTFSISHSQKIFLGFSIIIFLGSAVTFVFFILSQIVDSQKKHTFQKLSTRFYSYVLLPISSSTVLPIFLMAISFSFRTVSESDFLPVSLRSFLTLSTNTIVWVTLFIELKHIFVRSATEDLSQLQVKVYYAPAFLLYLLTSMITLCLWLQEGIEVFSYVLLGLSLLMLFWQLIVSPYTIFIHNFNIFCNLLTQVLFQTFLIVKDKKSQIFSQSVEGYASLTFCLFIAVCEILSIIRIIRAIIRSVIRAKQQPDKRKLFQPEIEQIEERLFKEARQLDDCLFPQQSDLKGPAREDKGTPINSILEHQLKNQPDDVKNIKKRLKRQLTAKKQQKLQIHRKTNKNRD